MENNNDKGEEQFVQSRQFANTERKATGSNNGSDIRFARNQSRPYQSNEMVQCRQQPMNNTQETQRFGNNNENRWRPGCYICGDFRHGYRFCPQKKIWCCRCGQEGFTERDCPCSNDNLNSNPRCANDNFRIIGQQTDNGAIPRNGATGYMHSSNETQPSVAQLLQDQRGYCIPSSQQQTIHDINFSHFNFSDSSDDSDDSLSDIDDDSSSGSSDSSDSDKKKKKKKKGKRNKEKKSKKKASKKNKKKASKKKKKKASKKYKSSSSDDDSDVSDSEDSFKKKATKKKKKQKKPKKVSSSDDSDDTATTESKFCRFREEVTRRDDVSKEDSEDSSVVYVIEKRERRTLRNTDTNTEMIQEIVMVQAINISKPPKSKLN